MYCFIFLSLVLWLLGYPGQALKRVQEAITLARELSHPYGLAFALSFGAVLHQHRRDVAAVQERAEAAMAAAIRSNQLRLYFSSFAYVLMQTLRRLGLEGTELAKAQCDTIRLKLLKIGAQLKVTVCKVWISFSESYPYLRLFREVFNRLSRIPARC